MTLEEILEKLGLNTEENKDKATFLKKEFNAELKKVNELTKKVATFEKDAETAKDVANKLDIATKAFNLDFTAKDIDAMIEEKKDALIKEAGGGVTPEEIKTLKRDLTKAQRERDSSAEEIKTLTEQLTAEKDHRISTAKRTALHKALEENSFIDPDVFVETFFNKVAVDDDGTTMTMKDATGNDISINDYIKDWAKDHSAFINSGAKGGSGSGKGGFAGSDKKSGLSSAMENYLKDYNNNQNNQLPKKVDLAATFG